MADGYIHANSDEAIDQMVEEIAALKQERDELEAALVHLAERNRVLQYELMKVKRL